MVSNTGGAVIYWLGSVIAWNWRWPIFLDFMPCNSVSTEMDALSTNRMPHRWLAAHAPTPTADLVTDFAALPFLPPALILAVLPHTLEFCADPHATLREVERVLVPEGRVVISGFESCFPVGVA